jgi:hypothetical protein
MTTDTTTPSFKGFQFPQQIIAHAVWLWWLLGSSTANNLLDFTTIFMMSRYSARCSTE